MRSLLQAWSRLEKEYPNFHVVAVTTRRSEGKDWCPHGYTGTLKVDATARWHQRFRATWWPRVYLQEGNGRLAYAQQPEQLDGEAERAVRQLLNARVSVAARDTFPDR